MILAETREKEQEPDQFLEEAYFEEFRTRRLDFAAQYWPCCLISPTTLTLPSPMLFIDVVAEGITEKATR